MKSLLLTLIVVSLVSLAACGGGTGIVTNPTFQIGGTVSGLTAGGLVLQDNGTDDLTISGNGPFHFATSVSSYKVTVSSQPNGQTCTVANGTGTATAQVTNVAVTCAATSSVTIAVVVSGLTSANTGMMIENNGQNPQPVNGNNTYDLTVPSGSTYAITVSTQPLNATCTVANGTGTANGNVSVTITCVPTVVGNVTISVVVSGLTPTMTGLVIENNGNTSNTLSVPTNGTYPISVLSGSTYNITVLTQPTGGTCTVANGSGTATTNETVTITCAASVNYTISGAVTGLTAGTLVLQDDKGDTLSYTGNTTQTFATSYASGTTYTVSVKTQPAGETCSLGSNATGTITANTTVAVTCSAVLYTISAAVSGLSGTLVLQDNGGNNLTITSNGTFPFTTQIASGAPYAVTVLTQPTGETCSLGSNASGTATGNVTVAVTCVSTLYTISAAVTGLTGTLVLQDNATNNLTITANGTFPFTTQIPSGGSYAVTVLTQPTGQSCSLGTNANGTATANVTVAVTCTASAQNYTISVAVTGLTGTLVVQDSKLESLAFTSNKTQTFPTSYASGSTYSVTITTQPTGQLCTLSSNASGTITSNITVNATCVSNYTISVAVTGLTGTLVMQDDKADTLTFTTNNTQTFASTYASGSTYTVSVKTQPTGQTCTLSSNATGTITGNTTVTATCTTTVVNYSISVAVTGLTGTLVMQDDKADTLTFTKNNTQTFATQYASGSTYTVSVKTQPTGQTCTLSSNASGTITGNVTVTATCTTTVVNYTISVAVTGLTGTLVMQDDKSDTLTFTTNDTQTFATSYASGSTYSVTVRTQPAGQTCTLSSNASGTITGNITVTATCAKSGGGLTISVNVTGLSGSVKLEDDQNAVLTFTNSGTQTFSNTYTSGATYSVYVTSQPTGQSCIPTYSTGTITSNVTINAACATGSTRALGTVSGVSTIACSGGIKNGVCQQMTVACPGVPNVLAYVKTNSPTGSPLGTVTYGTGTDGNGLYESIFTFGSTAVQNVLNAGYTTVQISWGTPFNSNQPDGWVLGPGGVLASACRYATVTEWIYNNIQKSTSIPYCATANSGGSGALAYALSQYPTSNILSMAEVTSGPPPGRLDWGCGCQEGKLAVQCGSATTLGTCFGTADAPVWDPAYNPNTSNGVCTNAVNGNLPPGGLNFFLGDSVEAPGAAYNLPKTFVNLVFGSADSSSAIPIGQDWFNNITTTKAQVCVPGGQHSMANTLAGAQQIANDLINLCRLQ